MSESRSESLSSSAPACRALNEAYPCYLWFAVFSALLGSLQFGYGYSVLNTALAEIKISLEHEYDEEVINSAVVLGSAVGAITAGVLADAAGPRRAQMYNVAAFLLGALLTSVPFLGDRGFLIGRLITGFGAGASSLYAPRYIAEIAPLELRGRLVSQCQVFVNVGILAGYCVGLPFEFKLSSVSLWGCVMPWWRIMTLLAVVPAVIQLLCLLSCPESPTWLESRDKERADEACIQLWGSRAILFEDAAADMEHCDSSGHGDGGLAALLLQPEVPPEGADPAGMLRMSQVRPAADVQEGWGDLWRYEYRWMLALAVGLPVLQQACGVNTVILYSSDVLSEAGLSKSAVYGSILVGTVNLLFTLLAASLMDRWGRRPLLLVSYTGMGACLLTIAHLNFTDHTGPELTAVLLIAYMIAFALGAGPVTSLYLSEILPTRIKGKAAALATALAWMSNWAVARTFDPDQLGRYYLLYGLLNVLALLYLFVLMPETKRRTMKEIEAMLLLPPKLKLRDLGRNSASQAAPLLPPPAVPGGRTAFRPWPS